MKILVMDWEYISNACKYYFYKMLSKEVEVINHHFFNLNRSMFSLNIPYNRHVAYPFSFVYRLFTLSGYLKKLKKIVKKESPNVLYFSERFASYAKYVEIEGIGGVLKAIFVGDPPRGDYTRLMNFIKLNSIDLAFYENSLWDKDLPDMKKELMPWSVDTEVFRDYGFESEYDVVSCGILSRYYPIRYKIKEILDNSKNMRYLKYPIFAPLIGRKMNMGEYFVKYAKFLSNSKIFIFHPGYSGRTVAKYVEGLASSSLVMAPMPLGGEFIHLVPGKNFVEINEENFIEKISYYLENEDERIKIAKRGMETARKFLDVKDSVSQFVRNLESVI